MNQDDINTQIDAGFDLVEAGKLTEALALFERVSQMDEQNAEAWMMRGSLDVELGNTDRARAELSKAIELDPGMPESYYYMANINYRSGNYEEAARYIDKSIQLDSTYGEAYLQGGPIYAMLNQLDQSESCCRKAVELMPGSADAYVNLGNILLQKGNPAEARENFSAATRLQPQSLVAWTMLGRTCARLEDLDQSLAAYRRALEINPQSEEAHYGIAFASHQQGSYEDAVTHFSRALELNPGYVDAASGLAAALQAMGRYEEALAAYDRGLQIDPSHANTLFGKASVLLELSRREEAIQYLQHLLQIRPDYVQAYLNLASALMTFSRLDEALEACSRALELQPDNIDAIAHSARIEQHGGQIDEAYQRLKPHVESGTVHVNLAVAFADVCRSRNCPEEAIGTLETLVSQSSGAIPVTSLRNIHFSLGSLYDKTRNFEKAFVNYKKGNELRGVDWNPATYSSQVDEVIGIFNKDFMQSAPRATHGSEKPVFVLGMPRSGTTLVEQILASHPVVHGAGELPDILHLSRNMQTLLNKQRPYPGCMPELSQPDLDMLAQQYLQHLAQLAPDAQRVVDKMPGNFNLLGLIELLFPDAKVIHCMRDPIDTCLSCYFQDFSRTQSFSYDLEHLAAFYRDYERLMAHWKSVLSIPVLDVSYEKLTEDQEGVSREMISFCGLEWDDSCLQFHETKRFVSTASYDQVRRPIYRSSVKRWENYRDHLGPLIDRFR